MLRRSQPEEAERLGVPAQPDVDERRRLYEQLAGIEHERRRPSPTQGGRTHDPRSAHHYMGLELTTRSSPLRHRSPATSTRCGRLEDAGAAAVVLPSLFEEQIEHDETSVDVVLERGAAELRRGPHVLPGDGRLQHGARCLRRARRRREGALSIPVIASVNGVTPGGWIRYAELLQQAGADAIELNVYAVETDPYASAGSVEDRTLRLVSRVHGALSVPLAVKVGPYYSAFANTAARLADAGASGLVLFNRFLQPDIDLETMTVKPELHLSANEEMQLPLRWIAILRGRVPASLAATSGVQTKRGRGEAPPRGCRRRHARLRAAAPWPEVAR